MKTMSKEAIAKLQDGGARVKREKRPPKVVEKPASPPTVREKTEVKVVQVDMSKQAEILSQQLDALETLVSQKRKPWRITINRGRSGLTESYDILPLEPE